MAEEPRVRAEAEEQQMRGLGIHVDLQRFEQGEDEKCRGGSGVIDIADRPECLPGGMVVYDEGGQAFHPGPQVPGAIRCGAVHDDDGRPGELLV